MARKPSRIFRGGFFIALSPSPANLKPMKRSAGILLYRGSLAALELLLVHSGGPFWASKDSGAW